MLLKERQIPYNVRFDCHLAADLHKHCTKVKQQRQSHKQLLKIHHNHAMAVETLKLVYINDGIEGIQRAKKGKGFTTIPLSSFVELFTQ